MREPPETTAPSRRTHQDRGRSFPHVAGRDGVCLDPCNVNDRVLPAMLGHADVSVSAQPGYAGDRGPHLGPSGGPDGAVVGEVDDPGIELL